MEHIDNRKWYFDLSEEDKDFLMNNLPHPLSLGRKLTEEQSIKLMKSLLVTKDKPHYNVNSINKFLLELSKEELSTRNKMMKLQNFINTFYDANID